MLACAVAQCFGKDYAAVCRNKSVVKKMPGDFSWLSISCIIPAVVPASFPLVSAGLSGLKMAMKTVIVIAGQKEFSHMLRRIQD